MRWIRPLALGAIVLLPSALLALDVEAAPPSSVRTASRAKTKDKAIDVRRGSRTHAARRTLASWYGTFHHGRPTASGERYNMWDLTAAHPTLPFGTRLLVTNVRNGRTVTVRVNDRGPHVPGRGIDLSYAAARALRAVGAGVVPVRLAPLSDLPLTAAVHGPHGETPSVSRE